MRPRLTAMAGGKTGAWLSRIIPGLDPVGYLPILWLILIVCVFIITCLNKPTGRQPMREKANGASLSQPLRLDAIEFAS